ncbi:hypothetical protein HYH03_003197 [Edaphochlamys debaryana]|uniref:starch synthase n=1 Tax=Edaphochlamys debaryana TaxID=47281 RepID=A0A835YDS2_9CHLO|nr:hypothetical protein HYH03_003197 [Edaphochlamys debaryana]|eukprot:KAG2499011.1 hypothetical protein HYH03_003197 [Edaphochlamys debaryana]
MRAPLDRGLRCRGTVAPSPRSPALFRTSRPSGARNGRRRLPLPPNSWFSQRSSSAAADTEDGSGNGNGGDHGDGEQQQPALSAEEEFLARARKMQSRIAKLRRLQDKIAKLKEEGDFAAGYAEVASAAADQDDDEDLEDWPTIPSSARSPGFPSPSTASSSPSTFNSSTLNSSTFTPTPTPASAAPPGSNGLGSTPPAPSGPGTTPDQLRSWVATLVAQSAARAAATAAAAAAAAAAPPGQAPASPPAPPSPGRSSIRADWRTQLAGELEGSPSQPPPPPQSQPPPPPAASTSAPVAPLSAPSTPGARSAATPAASANVAPIVRKYSVRYSSTAAKPTFVSFDGSAPPQPLAAPPQPSTAPLPSAPAPRPAPPPPPPPPPTATPGAPPAATPGFVPPPPTLQQFSRLGSTARPAAAPTPPPPPSASAAATAAPPARTGAAQPAAATPTPGPASPSTAAPAAGAAAPTAAGAAAAAAKPGTAAAAAAAAAPTAPTRDPNAELRATAFPDSLTSSNPYTLYDMPLVPRAMPAAWRTAAERKAAEAAGGGAAASTTPPRPHVDQVDKPRDLVFVTAEAAPWSKTGGLGDVMGALPKALAARGHRVMVVSPRYLSPATKARYEGLRDTGVRARIDLGPTSKGGGGVHEVAYFHLHKEGVDWVFVDHMAYHREGTPYGNAGGTYGDNLFRFSLLSLAACEAPLLLHIGGYRSGQAPGLPYGQAVTFVANDWHAALVPVYVAAKYRRHGVFKEARCVLALHNLAHQGAHPPHLYPSLGLPPEWYGALEWVDTGGDQEAGAGPTRTINILKAALVTSDRLVTVSPAYAWEVCDLRAEEKVYGKLGREKVEDMFGKHWMEAIDKERADKAAKEKQAKNSKDSKAKALVGADKKESEKEDAGFARALKLVVTDASAKNATKLASATTTVGAIGASTATTTSTSISRSSSSSGVGAGVGVGNASVGGGTSAAPGRVTPALASTGSPGGAGGGPGKGPATAPTTTQSAGVPAAPAKPPPVQLRQTARVTVKPRAKRPSEQTSSGADHGMGLTRLLRQRAAELRGIVNGIDTAEWDPRTDPYLPRNYHEGSLGGKGLCKAALQDELGLPVDPAAPLLGFIGRLDFQKGPDLVLGALRALVAQGCQVVMLGSGAPDYEEAFRSAAAAYPANVRAHVGFSVPLSHKIMAASDILLMPSRFEPCGLNQLYAMRYGTVPVAHGTGGLRDTIDDVNPFSGEAGLAAVSGEEELEALFATGLAWGRKTAPRSADDPAANNADYYEPFQDYFGSESRYSSGSDEDGDGLGGEGEDGEEGEGGGRRRGSIGTGWTFSPATTEGLLDAVTAALHVYEKHPDKWRRIQLAGMRRDWSWARAAVQWEGVFEAALGARAYAS